MEANIWVQKLIQIQLPELPTSKLDALEKSKELYQFLSDVNSMLLVICYDAKVNLFCCNDLLTLNVNIQNGKFIFFNDINYDFEESSAEYWLLSKLKPAVITGDNIGKLVRFVPISHSPLNELYQTIHSVFVPILQK